MTEYTLHCFLESGNAYKAALMLELNEAPWVAEFVDFMNGATRSEDYRTLNELGEVPVLVDHTMRDENEELVRITQSGVILHHLAQRYVDWGPRDPAEEREIWRWILWDNHKMTGMLAAYRFLTHFMKKENEATEFLGGRMTSSLKTLNRRLEGRDWVATDRPTIADLSICGYLFWPEQSGIDMNDYPNTKAWLARIASLPNFKRPEDILPSSAA